MIERHCLQNWLFCEQLKWFHIYRVTSALLSQIRYRKGHHNRPNPSQYDKDDDIRHQTSIWMNVWIWWARLTPANRQTVLYSSVMLLPSLCWWRFISYCGGRPAGCMVGYDNCYYLLVDRGSGASIDPRIRCDSHLSARNYQQLHTGAHQQQLDWYGQITTRTFQV